MENKITPLHDRVIIEPVTVSKETAGGIIIPDSAKEKPMNGKVIAVGKGKEGEPMTVKVNDQVLYGKHAGMPIEVGGKSYLIMKEADILAII
jgi:chaperonin GroES